MSRGLTDEPIEPQQSKDDELTDIINQLIKGQNKLHDRLVDLERKADHQPKPNCKCNKHNETESEAADRKFWKKGL